MVFEPWTLNIIEPWTLELWTLELWQADFDVLLLEPIYDNIEVEDPDSQIIFTLNGERGYVKEDGTFVPQSLSETLSEDEWVYILDECIRDQYDDEYF